MKRPKRPFSGQPPRSARTPRAAFVAGALVAGACSLWPDAAAAEPALQDYRYFRALSIDLRGRLPTRGEIAAFEQPDFDMDAWIDERLAGPRYAERIRRVYMDLLRLDVGASFNYRPRTMVLRRVTVVGPNGQDLHVYYRQGQRRTRVETDGVFCMTFAETGMKFNPNGTPTPGSGNKTVTQAVLDANTVLVKPWWLYRDYDAATPTDKYDPATWDTEHPGYKPVDGLLTGGNDSPSTRSASARRRRGNPSAARSSLPASRRRPPPARTRPTTASSTSRATPISPPSTRGSPSSVAPSSPTSTALIAGVARASSAARPA
jgi:hypothetical protein